MTDLTEKQSAVLQFIEDYQMQHGSSPTLREMRVHFEVRSDNSILKHLKSLEDKGYLKKSDTPRGIAQLDSVKQRLEIASNVISVPLLGHIAAGGPVMSEEHVLDQFELSSSLVKRPEGCFALRVQGLSMQDAGIFEGDLVVADPKQSPRDGDIVVALVDEENTIKRYRTHNGRVWLQAENPDYSDINPETQLEIQGVVVALVRKY